MSTVIHDKINPENGPACLWLQNGDHPDDGPADKEGKVIRYFRHPVFKGQDVCAVCGEIFHDHGFLEDGMNGNVYEGIPVNRVCPGSWILNSVTPGKYLVYTEKSFLSTTYHIESMNNKTYATNYKMRMMLQIMFGDRINDDEPKKLYRGILTAPFKRHSLTVTIGDSESDVLLSLVVG